eukprot:SAG31_NODE_2514_length_5582_cov_7.795367_2_plen_1449_part_00
MVAALSDPAELQPGAAAAASRWRTRTVPAEAAAWARTTFELRLALHRPDACVTAVHALSNPLAQHSFSRRTAGVRLLEAFLAERIPRHTHAADHCASRREAGGLALCAADTVVYDWQAGGTTIVDVGCITAETLAAADRSKSSQPHNYRLLFCKVAVGAAWPVDRAALASATQGGHELAPPPRYDSLVYSPTVSVDDADEHGWVSTDAVQSAPMKPTRYLVRHRQVLPVLAVDFVLPAEQSGSPRDGDVLCPYHAKAISHYCTQCQIPLCPDCIRCGSHATGVRKGHLLEPITEAGARLAAAVESSSVRGDREGRKQSPSSGSASVAGGLASEDPAGAARLQLRKSRRALRLEAAEIRSAAADARKKLAAKFEKLQGSLALAESASLRALATAEAELGMRSSRIAAADDLLANFSASACNSCAAGTSAGLVRHWASHMTAGGGVMDEAYAPSGQMDGTDNGTDDGNFVAASTVVSRAVTAATWTARKACEFRLEGDLRLCGRSDGNGIDVQDWREITVQRQTSNELKSNLDQPQCPLGRTSPYSLTKSGAVLLAQARAAIRNPDSAHTDCGSSKSTSAPLDCEPWLDLPLAHIPGQWVVTRTIAWDNDEGRGMRRALEVGFCRAGGLGLTLGPWRYGVGGCIQHVDPASPAGLRSPALAAGLLLAAVNGGLISDFQTWDEIEAALNTAGFVDGILSHPPLTLIFVPPPVDPEPEPEPETESESEILRVMPACEDAPKSREAADWHREDETKWRPPVPVGVQPLSKRIAALGSAVNSLDLHSEPYGPVFSIQRMVRGWLVRDRLLIQHGAASYIQAIWRGAQARLLMIHLRAAEGIMAAVFIQKICRMCRAKKMYTRYRAATIRVQTATRRRHAVRLLTTLIEQAAADGAATAAAACAAPSAQQESKARASAAALTIQAAVRLRWGIKSRHANRISTIEMGHDPTICSAEKLLTQKAVLPSRSKRNGQQGTSVEQNLVSFRDEDDLSKEIVISLAPTEVFQSETFSQKSTSRNEAETVKLDIQINDVDEKILTAGSENSGIFDRKDLDQVQSSGEILDNDQLSTVLDIPDSMHSKGLDSSILTQGDFDVPPDANHDPTEKSTGDTISRCVSPAQSKKVSLSAALGPPPPVPPKPSTSLQTSAPPNSSATTALKPPLPPPPPPVVRQGVDSGQCSEEDSESVNRAESVEEPEQEKLGRAHENTDQVEGDTVSEPIEDAELQALRTALEIAEATKTELEVELSLERLATTELQSVADSVDADTQPEDVHQLDSLIETPESTPDGKMMAKRRLAFLREASLQSAAPEAESREAAPSDIDLPKSDNLEKSGAFSSTLEADIASKTKKGRMQLMEHEIFLDKRAVPDRSPTPSKTPITLATPGKARAAACGTPRLTLATHAQPEELAMRQQSLQSHASPGTPSSLNSTTSCSPRRKGLRSPALASLHPNEMMNM